MPSGLRRFQLGGGLHFITFSCYHRLPHLNTPAARDLFENALETVRLRYRLAILGYVVMPEHVHLLLSEPARGTLAQVIQALKLSVAVRRTERPFWQARYYDFNVHSAEKTTEKLDYIHRNPVERGLVTTPGDWPWSSFRHYASGEPGRVEIESFWTAWKRNHAKASVLENAPAGRPAYGDTDLFHAFSHILLSKEERVMVVGESEGIVGSNSLANDKELATAILLH